MHGNPGKEVKEMAGNIKGNTIETLTRINDLINTLEYADITVLREVKSSLQLLRNATAKAINEVDKSKELQEKSTKQKEINKQGGW